MKTIIELGKCGRIFDAARTQLAVRAGQRLRSRGIRRLWCGDMRTKLIDKARSRDAAVLSPDGSEDTRPPDCVMLVKRWGIAGSPDFSKTVNGWFAADNKKPRIFSKQENKKPGTWPGFSLKERVGQLGISFNSKAAIKAVCNTPTLITQRIRSAFVSAILTSSLASTTAMSFFRAATSSFVATSALSCTSRTASAMASASPSLMPAFLNR